MSLGLQSWLLILLNLVVAGSTSGIATQLDIGLVPPVPRQGQALVVEVRGAQPGDVVSGELFGRELRFYLDEAGRLRALTAVAHDRSVGPASISIHLSPPHGHTVIFNWPIRVLAGAFGEQKLRVRQRFIQPPQQAFERIQREQAELDAVRARKPTARKWRDSFIWPRKDRITSEFGLKRVYNDQLERVHLGLDIDGGMGDTVKAINGGTVILASERYYSGGTLIIDHGLGLHSLYYHLSHLNVKVGDQVRKGQLIGAVGRSGRVTGPHLHLGVETGGLAVDPISLFELDLQE